MAPSTAKIRDSCQEVLDVWMDMILADMRVDAAEDLHHPGLRYTILLIRLERRPLNSSFEANCCSSLIECDFPALLSRMLRSWVGNDISEFV